MLAPFVATIGSRARSLFADPVRRFELSIVALGLLILLGTGGYIVLEEMRLSDAFYMTIITVTTVGFAEVQPLSTVGRLFTSMLILLGVGVATTAVSNAISIVLGPLMWLSIRERKMEAKIRMMEGHFVVCGYGRMGEQIVRDLQARNQPYVIVEADTEITNELLEENVLHITGDATTDETLLKAGIDRAKGFVAALNADADNVMAVLTARELNPKLFIVARASHPGAESKLRRAGANRVVSPYQIGGHRMAVALLRPAVHDFMEQIFSAGDDMDLGEVPIGEDSKLAGKTIAATDLRRTRHVSIIAIQRANGEIVINPNTQHVITPGETLIVIGHSEAIYRIEEELDVTAGNE
ncbi:MAG: potassium channel protein [Chloroflexi bacterium]|nr:MAG: potassium channel protein [Phototrophicales bacterium]RMF80879.1 MAG: potassium channel protein [Chloroflexota bacterium]